jgi:hypothetical protein
MRRSPRLTTFGAKSKVRLYCIFDDYDGNYPGVDSEADSVTKRLWEMSGLV